jgi:hypothetical protein
MDDKDENIFLMLKNDLDCKLLYLIQSIIKSKIEIKNVIKQNNLKILINDVKWQ